MTERLYLNGRIATVRKARKSHTCDRCAQSIPAGVHYYEVVIGGGGLGSLKFPERTHVQCLQEHQKAWPTHGKT